MLLFLLVATAFWWFSLMDFGARVYSGQGLVSFGDSFTSWQGSYVNDLSAHIGGSLNNQAAGGTGTTQATRSALASLPVNRKAAVSTLAGFNDIGLCGSPSIELIKSNTRSLIAAALLKENAPASALRSSGAWSALGGAYGGRAFAIGGTGMFTIDPAAYLEWDFFGETLVVGAYATNVFLSGGPWVYRPVRVSIDGGPYQLLETANINTTEDYAYVVMVLKNLGYTKHTVRLSVDDPSYYTTVDYVGTLIEPAAARGVLVGGIPTRTDWGSGLATQAMTDTANAAIESVVSEFSEYPVRYVAVEDYYSSVGPDGIHPDSAGHDQIFQAFKSRISLW